MVIKKGKKCLSWMLVCALMITQLSAVSVFAEEDANIPKTEETQQAQDKTDEPEQQKSDQGDKESAPKAEPMPAQTLTGKASDGAVVTVKAAKGTFEEGAVLKVRTVKKQSVEKAIEAKLPKDRVLKDLAAYDITIQNKDGKIVQPHKDVSVVIKGAEVEGETVAVYHIDSNKSKAEKIAAVKNGNNAQFTAEHFSIYVVTGTGNAELADNKTYHLTVGETRNVECDLDHRHNWKSSNSSIAYVTTKGDSNQNKSQFVKAVQAGTTAISCGGSSFTIKVNAEEHQVTFKANGGNGGDYVMTAVNNALTLPTAEEAGISNNGKILSGWATDGKASGFVFKEGFEASITKDVTYYAVWIDPEGTGGNHQAYFYIRIDGEIQYEPSNYNGNNYYPKGSAKSLTGKLRTTVPVNNSLEKVEANLLKKPSDEEIKKVLEREGASYDPETQYVQWYVIKHRAAGSPTEWNVDGVIRSKAKHEVIYNPNGGTKDCPGSNEYAKGAQVDVQFKPLPVKSGYDFLGWDEDKDAVSPTYKEGGSSNNFTMPDKDVVLYAVWGLKNEITINYVANNGGQVTPSYETLNPELGEAKGSTAKPSKGYSFVKWTDSEGITVSQEGRFTPAKDKKTEAYQAATYTAHFKAEPAKILFEENGGSSVEDMSGVTDQKIDDQSLPVTTKEGYEFSGWYDNEALTGTALKELPALFPAGTTTYYAKWVRSTGGFGVTGYTGKYDGEEHTVTVSGTLLQGESWQYSTDGKTWSKEQPQYKNAGSVTVWARVAGKSDKTLWEGSANVEISKREITLTSATDSKTYDGEELTNKEVIETGDGFVKDEKLSFDVTGSQLDAGESDNTFTCEPANEATNLKNYQIKEVYGTLTVDQKALTIIADSANRSYNGKTLTANGYSSDPLASGDEIKSVTVVGSQLDPGTSDNLASDAVIKRGGKVVTENYNINYVKGTLTVTKNDQTIVIAANNNSKVYDGSPLTDNQYTYTKDVLAEGDKLTAEVTGSITNAGTVANRVKSYKVMRGNKDVTENYTFDESQDGQLSITKRKVTLTSGSAEKDWDGNPLTNDEITVNGDGFAANEGASYNVDGIQLDPGDSENTFTYTLKDNTKEENYNITPVYGTLTVNYAAYYEAGTLSVTKSVFQDNAASPSRRTFYAGLFKDAACTQPVEDTNNDDKPLIIPIAMNGKAAAASAPTEIPFNEKGQQWYVTEVTAKGVPVKATDNFRFSIGSAGNTVMPIEVGRNGEVSVGLRNEYFSSQPTFNPVDNGNGSGPTDGFIGRTVTTLTRTTAANAGGARLPVAAGPAAQLLIPPNQVPLAPAVAAEDGLGTTTIGDQQVPLAAGEGHWALLNLILTIITALLSILLLILYFTKRRKQEDSEMEQPETEIKRKGILRIFTVVVAVVSIVTFILTEDMSLPMQWTDKWTLLMTVLAVIQAIATVLSKKKEKDKEDETYA